MDKYEALFYPEVAFGGFTRFDGTIEFYQRVNAMLGTKDIVIDFGCGRGQHSEDPLVFRRDLQCLKGKVAKVIGIDVDPNASSNPTVDEFRMLTEKKWPVEDRSANLVVCDYVIEHLQTPEALFAEAQRVLIPHGYLCIRTTNCLSYVGVAARMVPNAYHAKVLSRVQQGRKAGDIFPTLYRCNTVGALRRELKLHGFRAAVYGHDAGPGYLAFSKVAYSAGMVLQRLMPDSLKPMIMAFGELNQSPK